MEAPLPDTDLAAYAELKGGGEEIWLRALVALPDGSESHRAERRGPASDAEALGRDAGATRCGIWLRHPWMSVRTVASIYWQAFRLRRKGVPMYPHESAVVSR